MIAKLHKGKGFRAVLEYSFRVSKGYLLDSNMGGTNPRELSKEFNTEIRIQDSKGYIDMNESK